MTCVTDAVAPATTIAHADVSRCMLAALCAALKQHGVVRAVITYDGYGDEGQIESVSTFDDAGEVTVPVTDCQSWDVPWRGEPVERIVTLSTALENFGYEMLARHQPGWENGDGAFGECTIDVAAKRAELDHSVRFTAIEGFAYELRG